MVANMEITIQNKFKLKQMLEKRQVLKDKQDQINNVNIGYNRQISRLLVEVFDENKNLIDMFHV